jgi:uncharacterized protein
MNTTYNSIIQKELQLKSWQVENTVTLILEGCTIPFISRYRKEKTGSLDEVQVEQIQQRHKQLETLDKRKASILKAIEEQNKLTDELRNKISSSWDEKEIEDYYLPYKTKRQTKADKAISAGLAPLAKMILAQNNDQLIGSAGKYRCDDYPSNEDVLDGAKNIASQWISERIGVRNMLRRMFVHEAVITSKLVKGKEEEAEKFKDYFDFSELAKKAKSHRILALLRGSEEGLLKVSIQPDKKQAILKMEGYILKEGSKCADVISDVVKDAYQRLLRPSLENELVKDLKLKADEEAIKVFAQNLKQLLLQPPLGSFRTLAIDPGFRTGCKIVCLDENGNLLNNVTIYPHPPQRETAMAKKKISTLVEQYQIEAIAIGNGTASRETERFIKGIRFDRKVRVFVVNEAGASIYSASKIAREEFPSYDVTVRGAVSIGRRLMDPLAELVKIDAKSIGVGQYQHDVDQKLLQEKLDNVVISCVNKVGVDLNTASKYLLNYISGIGPVLAENIVKYRKEIGGFSNRNELLNVAKMGPKAFEQAAGFLRIREGNQPLDNSSVHPERYGLIHEIATASKLSTQDLIGNEEILEALNPNQFISDEVGLETLTDILDELKKPGRDPRKLVKVFEFDPTLKTIENLEVGKSYPGIVNNVTNFGAFIDLGIKENGLIHISNLSDEYISNPAEVISLHEHVMVEVIEVDVARKRIGLKRINE